MLFRLLHSFSRGPFKHHICRSIHHWFLFASCSAIINKNVSVHFTFFLDFVHVPGFLITKLNLKLSSSSPPRALTIFAHWPAPWNYAVTDPHGGCTLVYLYGCHMWGSWLLLFVSYTQNMLIRGTVYVQDVDPYRQRGTSFGGGRFPLYK